MQISFLFHWMEVCYKHIAVLFVCNNDSFINIGMQIADIWTTFWSTSHKFRCFFVKNLPSNLPRNKCDPMRGFVVIVYCLNLRLPWLTCCVTSTTHGATSDDIVVTPMIGAILGGRLSPSFCKIRLSFSCWTLYDAVYFKQSFDIYMT